MITIPENLWSEMLTRFAKETRRVEQVCYFDGVVVEGKTPIAVATTLTIPNAILHCGYFEVPAEAMSQAGKHMRALRLRRLAQVHTHPTEWTGHSPTDDARAYSQMNGAISIVLPDFGRGNPTLGDAGIHLRETQGWRQLDHDEASRQIRLVPSLFDFRSQPRRKYGRLSIKSPRRYGWRDIIAFWKH
jgi:hypothetical protein